MTGSRLRGLSAAVALAGVLLLSQGGWIYVKARLAQVLLHRAWSRTLAGGRAVKPWPWADTWPVARLRIPGTGTDTIVLAGASGRTLAFGPGHLDGSAAPGAPGNCVFSAHRDTHFAFLARLTPGEEVVVQVPAGGTTSYRVVSAGIVDRSSTGALEPTSGRTLTLVTCYPFDAIAPGGRLRYVVRAKG
ncbi:MAG: class GN sortase [Acidobacteria bacterium]|nr:class GN sortase [Acidobacteriota bacterium]MCA1611625.1 class GN sortase [Acidobacteriota bacterium]